MRGEAGECDFVIGELSTTNIGCSIDGVSRRYGAAESIDRRHAYLLMCESYKEAHGLRKNSEYNGL